MTKLVTLDDRAVLRVSGAEAAHFLSNLVTNNVEILTTEPSIMAALLSPQGKILYEFFISLVDGAYYLETAKGGLSELVEKLERYKLRADVVIEDVSDHYITCWLDDNPFPDGGHAGPGVVLYPDPRHQELGWRALLPIEGLSDFAGQFESGSGQDYLSERLMLGMPEGGYDYVYGDTFPHEAGLDVLKAVDFQKGCYVGQEVVSRMEHRANVKRRIVIVEGQSQLPLAGAEIRAGHSLLGILGSSYGGQGLALVRLDRVARAVAGGVQMTIEGVLVRLAIPTWAPYEFPAVSSIEERD